MEAEKTIKKAKETWKEEPGDEEEELDGKSKSCVIL